MYGYIQCRVTVVLGPFPIISVQDFHFYSGDANIPGVRHSFTTLRRLEQMSNTFGTLTLRASRLFYITTFNLKWFSIQLLKDLTHVVVSTPERDSEELELDT